MGSDFTITWGTIFIALFYGVVIAAILITFWKVHAISSALDEVRRELQEMKKGMENAGVLKP